MNKLQTIINTISGLQAINYTDGFGDCVSMKVMEALNEDMTGKFWNYDCGHDHDKMIAEYFEGDVDAFKAYVEFKKEANENGFKMPSWGIGS